MAKGSRERGTIATKNERMNVLSNYLEMLRKAAVQISQDASDTRAIQAKQLAKGIEDAFRKGKVTKRERFAALVEQGNALGIRVFVPGL